MRDYTEVLSSPAQLCAASISGAAMPGFTFHDIDRLSAFSDYRLPQLFRLHKILTLTPELEATIETEGDVPEGSAEEIELRAASQGC
jgi:hypothetical protein